jgi:hypothetical protein
MLRELPNCININGRENYFLTGLNRTLKLKHFGLQVKMQLYLNMDSNLCYSDCS